MTRYVKLSCRSNQAVGIGQYAIDFLAGRLGQPDDAVLAKVEQFHLDSVACGVSDEGALLVQTANGIAAVASGEVSVRLAPP